MTYPNYKNKHREQALFTADDFVRYKGRDKLTLPKNYIIVYQSDTINHFKRKYRGQYKKIKISSLADFYNLGDIGVIKLKGIGAPNAGTVLEELIALGGKRFLNIGTAGGLQNEGIFLCEKSIRDEGTSSHYIKHSKYAYPNKKLTSLFAKAFERNNTSFDYGTSWTIDIPYRETEAEVKHYHNEGVATVEMESSALFTIAKIRNVQIAAAFAVSDLLVKEWEPKFHESNLKRNLGKLVDVSIDCLRK